MSKRLTSSHCQPLLHWFLVFGLLPGPLWQTMTHKALSPSLCLCLSLLSQRERERERLIWKCRQVVVLSPQQGEQYNKRMVGWGHMMFSNCLLWDLHVTCTVCFLSLYLLPTSPLSSLTKVQLCLCLCLSSHQQWRSKAFTLLLFSSPFYSSFPAQKHPPVPHQPNKVN